MLRVVLVVVGVALLSSTASAARIATLKEKKLIAASVRSYVRTSGCCAASRVGLTKYRVSDVDADFARVTVITKTPTRETGPRATAVLVHTFGDRWVTLAFGTAALVCGLDQAIRADLALPACH